MQKVFMVLFGVLLLACGEDRSNSSPTIISILFQEQAVFPSKIVEIIPLETRQDALIGLYYSVLSTRDYLFTTRKKSLYLIKPVKSMQSLIVWAKVIRNIFLLQMLRFIRIRFMSKIPCEKGLCDSI